jgi:hypothetical protein
MRVFIYTVLFLHLQMYKTFEYFHNYLWTKLRLYMSQWHKYRRNAALLRKMIPAKR